MRRTVILLAAAVVPLAMLVPNAAANSNDAPAAALGIGVASGGGDGTVGLAAARAMRQGYLVPNQRSYAESKAAAAQAVTPSAQQPETSSAAPVTGVSWEGLADPSVTPSDSTGAIGTTRYIETVNEKVGIYDRTGSLISSDSLDNFWSEQGNSNFDPQVMWDAKTKRF